MIFKIGDLVEITPYNGTHPVGAKAKIIAIKGKHDIEVEFLEKPRHGHEGSGIGRNGYCWHLSELCIKLSRTPEEDKEYKKKTILKKFKEIEARHLSISTNTININPKYFTWRTINLEP